VSIQNAFFVVERPFRFYRQIGISQSNTWIGRSQVFTNVHHALNAVPGDEFHALVGGLFVADRRDGGPSAAPARLSAPKPPLEKNYGSQPADRILRGMVERGLVREIPRSEARAVDYVAAREAASAELAPHRPAVIELVPSPLMVAFRERVAAFAATLEELGGAIAWRDLGDSPTVVLKADLGQAGRIGIEHAYLPDFHVVDVPPAFEPDWPAGSEKWGPEGRTCMRLPKDADVPAILDEVLGKVFAELHPEEDAAPGPRP
jgi:hypothetical protein